MHINKINNKKYIGTTMQDVKVRWGSNGNGYRDQPTFYKEIKKYGWDNFKHEILYENLNKEDAEKIETKLIELYKTRDENYGYNKCVGGQGSKGCKLTERHKQAISNAQTGRQRTKEQREQVSLHFQEYYKNNPNPNEGKKHSHETIQKIKKSKVDNGNCNHLYQFDLQGNLIAEYDSALDMSRQTGFDRRNIMASIAKKERSAITPYGFIWSMDANINLDDYKKPDRRKPINQYDMNGNFIKTYPSILNASKINNYGESKIINVCKGRSESAYGYKWEYANKENV